MPKGSKKKELGSAPTASRSGSDSAPAKSGGHNTSSSTKSTKRTRSGESKSANPLRLKKKTKKTTKGKKPDSGYTLFFKSENARLTESGEDIAALHEREVLKGAVIPPGFNKNRRLVTLISHRWNNLDIMERLKWDTMARKEKEKATAEAKCRDVAASDASSAESEEGASDGISESSDNRECRDKKPSSMNPYAEEVVAASSMNPYAEEVVPAPYDTNAKQVSVNRGRQDQLPALPINIDPTLIQQILAIPLESLEAIVSYKRRSLEFGHAQPSSNADAAQSQSNESLLVEPNSITAHSMTVANTQHPTAQQRALSLIMQQQQQQQPASTARMDTLGGGHNTPASQVLLFLQQQQQPPPLVVPPTAAPPTPQTPVEQLLARLQGTFAAEGALARTQHQTPPQGSVAGFGGGTISNIQNLSQLPQSSAQPDTQPGVETLARVLGSFLRANPPR